MRSNIQHPTSNIQEKPKLQAPKRNRTDRLEFGVWAFLGNWNLRFGISPLLVLALATAIIPARALAQRPMGIDVSSYEGGSINWATAKSSGSIAFAWAKATEGLTVNDADFTINE